jgi:TolA-binding protein
MQRGLDPLLLVRARPPLVSACLGALVATLLVACGSGPRKIAGDDAPTLKSLDQLQVVVGHDHGVKSDEEKTIAAYQQFLAATPKAAQRTDAMRRLGDLEMDRADTRIAAGQADGGPGSYRAAITRYQDYLKAFPNDPANDKVLYQLARAHEQGGELETALKTLDRLVQEYPATRYRDEAQFRRGELLFAMRDYTRAEQAYALVLNGKTRGDARNPYRERALYMQGWSMFKLGRLEDGLRSFFGVLDLKLASNGNGPGGAAAGSDAPLESLPGLTRADRELVEDTFRVTSLSLENLQGAETIPAYINTPERHAYEFRVYQQLGELYLKQDRIKDAADTFSLFARRNPLHAQAPLLQTRVIEIYQQTGFANLALNAKKEYVARYGVDSEFRRANPEGWEKAQPLVKTHVAELARHFHAAAQKSKKSEDYQEAVRWYRAYLSAFPNDPQAAQNNFLLAELLYEDARFPEAAGEYEKTAYEYPPHERAADAGYAALLAYTAQEKRAQDKSAAPAEHVALQRTSIDSAQRFAKAFPADKRLASVLTNAAEKLFVLKEPERSSEVAKQLLALNPPADAAQRRVGWTVLAHSAFDSGKFDRAEMAYGEVLALTPEKDPKRGELTERLAASIYKQGEQARDAGDLRVAADQFARVGSAAPASAMRATAQYDAAAALLALKDWAGAAKSLEDFRQRYPKDPLALEAGDKLAVAYFEQGQWTRAAVEFERMAATRKDSQLARAALWQAAELYEKSGEKAANVGVAVKTYERYIKLYPEPFEANVEARYRLARIAASEGNAALELARMKDVLQADRTGGAARTARTRTLGAMAALAVAAPVYEAYDKVALVEPLQKQLKLKKAKMEDVLKAYGAATEYGIADVTTATTYQTAALYQNFGHALMTSERPKKLSKAEREQYDVLLEEQAFPFEEKAIELHELNVRRSADGIYDEWVRKSYAALAELRPVRFGKTERSTASRGGLDEPRELNERAITLRQKGDFAKARETYEKAIALDPAYAAPTLNLAILNDLYLWNRTQALTLYERYLALSPSGDAVVSKWVADLKNRKEAP